MNRNRIDIKRSTLYLLIIPAMLLMISSCSTQNMMHRNAMAKDTAWASHDPGYQYHIRKDDKISVSLWNNDDMSVGSVYGIYNSNEVYGKWLLVDGDGNIQVPQLGPVHVKDSTVMQARSELVRLYAKWVKDPVVDVKVLNKEVNMMGELKTPGKYVVEKDYNTLLDMVSRAGDFDFYADRKHVTVIRNANYTPQKIVIDLKNVDPAFAKNVQIYPGDVVYVPSRKGKVWDKRSGSIIVPIATLISSIVLINSLTK